MRKPIYKVVVTNLVTDKSPEIIIGMIEQWLQPIKQMGTKVIVKIEETNVH